MNAYKEEDSPWGYRDIYKLKYACPLDSLKEVRSQKKEVEPVSSGDLKSDRLGYEFMRDITGQKNRESC